MSATHTVHSTTTAAPVLYVAFELGWTTWKMEFTIGAGQPPRVRTVAARCTSFVLSEIKKAKLRFGLPANAPVVACYEAGRDGFWMHRFLVHQGIQNIVVDSASIEVSRRRRRAKSGIRTVVLRGKKTASDCPKAAEKNDIQRMGDLRIRNERTPARSLRIEIRS